MRCPSVIVLTVSGILLAMSAGMAAKEFRRSPSVAYAKELHRQICSAVNMPLSSPSPRKSIPADTDAALLRFKRYINGVYDSMEESDLFLRELLILIVFFSFYLCCATFRSLRGRQARNKGACTTSPNGELFLGKRTVGIFRTPLLHFASNWALTISGISIVALSWKSRFSLGVIRGQDAETLCLLNKAFRMVERDRVVTEGVAATLRGISAWVNEVYQLTRVIDSDTFLLLVATGVTMSVIGVVQLIADRCKAPRP